MVKIREMVITSTNIGEMFDNPKLFGVIPDKYKDGEYELKPLGDCAIKIILSGEIPAVEIVKD